ncbi:MAG: hypothetical protein IT510_03700 [Sulfuritalea sp.]|nr:hypothetical protein [Sulfuritalea sp.]
MSGGIRNKDCSFLLGWCFGSTGLMVGLSALVTIDDRSLYVSVRPQPAGQGNRPISKSEAPSAAAECPDYSEQIDVGCFDSAEAANAVKHN